MLSECSFVILKSFFFNYYYYSVKVSNVLLFEMNFLFEIWSNFFFEIVDLCLILVFLLKKMMMLLNKRLSLRGDNYHVWLWALVWVNVWCYSFSGSAAMFESKAWCFDSGVIKGWNIMRFRIMFLSLVVF